MKNWEADEFRAARFGETWYYLRAELGFRFSADHSQRQCVQSRQQRKPPLNQLLVKKTMKVLVEARRRKLPSCGS